MPLFLYVTCRRVTELIDMCLAFWRPTQSHVKAHAIFLAYIMLHIEICICNTQVEIDCEEHILTEKMTT